MCHVLHDGEQGAQGAFKCGSSLQKGMWLWARLSKHPNPSVWPVNHVTLEVSKAFNIYM